MTPISLRNAKRAKTASARRTCRTPRNSSRSPEKPGHQNGTLVATATDSSTGNASAHTAKARVTLAKPTWPCPRQRSLLLPMPTTTPSKSV
eukprot:4171529-Pleurochrysis_carterae.AAC.2